MAFGNEFLLVPLVIFLFVLVLVLRSVVIIAQDQLGIVLRLGRYQATLSPGFHLRIPMIDIVKKVDHNSDIPRWNALSPNQRVAAAQSLVLLGTVDLNFKPKMIIAKADKEVDEIVQRSLSALPRSKERDLLVHWLTEQASAQTGVSLAGDSLAAVRLTEAAHRVLGTLNSTDNFEVDLPYIAADARGPKHFKLTLTRAELDTVLKK